MLMTLSNRVRSVSLQRLQMATVEVHVPSSNSSSQKDCKEQNSQGIKMSCANKKKWPDSDKSYKPKHCQRIAK